MKLLIRPAKPESLNDFRHGLNQWGEFITIENNRQEIWRQIDVMQRGFCAYCECTLNNKHVEHFRSRDKYPTFTFCWNNLFGSCNSNSRCGRYRDNSNSVGSYDPSELIKPDEDNPSEYLIFLKSGHVRVRSKLTPNKQKKATETLRALNLGNDPALINSRKRALSSELCNIKSTYELKNCFSDEEWLEIINIEINSLQEREFQTALEHAWKYNQDY